ncbi:MAG: hypothetical protein DHS20C15_10540 [Planctomycetota bacterium]|nr:MAG: hypothetical protein DHS20C15_10540 [Planctomycetota bacterium]
MESDDVAPPAPARQDRQAAQPTFDDAWRSVAPAVFAWASLHVRAPLRTRLDPDDVLQEIACRAWKHRERWDPAQGEFRAWVFGIANNVLRESLRHLTSTSRRATPAPLSTDMWAQLPDTATRISRAVLRDERLAKLLDHLDELPDDERRLLILRGLEGLPHEEVAEVLGLSTEAVSKRWQRLCAKLREQRAWTELGLE